MGYKILLVLAAPAILPIHSTWVWMTVVKRLWCEEKTTKIEKPRNESP
jgi:hypothetical protein